MRKHTFLVVGDPPPLPYSFDVTLSEIIHHLRSSLDHLVYQLAILEAERIGKRVTKSTQRGFPVFKHEPVTQKQKSRYMGKVHGLPAKALTLIEHMQPWKIPPHPSDYPLTILDDLNNADKHRLPLVVAAGFNFVSMTLGTTDGGALELDDLDMRLFKTHMELKDGAEIGHAYGSPNMKVNIQQTPAIAFSEIGTAQYQPVIPALAQIRNFVVETIDIFEKRLF